MLASERITSEALSWPGVEIAPHRFGGVELRIGRRELGHLHGEEIADLPLRRDVRDRLIAEGRARAHRWRPGSGWVTIPIDDDAGVETALGLLRASYERARARRTSQ